MHQVGDQTKVIAMCVDWLQLVETASKHRDLLDIYRIKSRQQIIGVMVSQLQTGWVSKNIQSQQRQTMYV